MHIFSKTRKLLLRKCCGGPPLKLIIKNIFSWNQLCNLENIVIFHQKYQFATAIAIFGSIFGKKILILHHCDYGVHKLPACAEKVPT